MRDRRVLWLVAAVAALVALFIVLRPADDAGPTANRPATTGDTATGAPTTPELEPVATDTTSATETAATVRQTVVIEGGRPVGGLARIDATQGQTVIMFFRSDEEDEIHVHGYDVKEPVGPGNVARVVLSADRAGRFEIELHHHARQVAQLTVTP